MKIVTYNVNGLRHRVSQYTSLRRLLDSLDADIICFQETKLSRHELRADLVRAEGYESFFSCTRTSEKGRSGYSGVATFCRVKSAFSSDEVALPVSAEEGFTGVLRNSPGFGLRNGECPSVVEVLEDFSTTELLKIDGEGRCIITDHGHFVLFNVYGPRAGCDGTERIQFKLNFFNILQRRLDSLSRQGRRVFVVGDLNIAPAAIDRCDAGPDFERNEFRTWFRSLLVRNGGPFSDAFREKHPERREAYTCWSTSSGAEEFNFGSRIDHILISGSCLHENQDERHSFMNCHVKECDILEQFKRWKPGNTPRWKAGRNVKLEGSDHVPVYVCLMEIPNVPLHNTPSLSSRYCPEVYGFQKTLVSMFERKQPTVDVSFSGGSTCIAEDSNASKCCSQLMKRPLQSYNVSSSTLRKHENLLSTSSGDISEVFSEKSPNDLYGTKELSQAFSSVESNKKARKSQLSQLSLKSYFKKTAGVIDYSVGICVDKKLSQSDILNPHLEQNKNLSEDIQLDVELKSVEGPLILEDDASMSSEERNGLALVEWQRIQQVMQTSIPLCKGHKEPCVPRVVKKPGPNIGRRFFVCARAEVSLSCNLVSKVLPTKYISYLNVRRSSTHPINSSH
ncbi:DNA-(apurinic or apyrimidinic site) lyase 2 [Dorcoceras hygrometricum]|uniref:DNA-(apurinic or apyrimidinic site) endonuclease 2 n=1 Tax=Dorcoceras hygrometricum TaxID=472368 RepID=A0A2Z7B9R0_9LAMI|nr:DNA-(apurinic or apyrimidinic site) lyase 2 [Dorcoceras hygrometricum]